MADILIRNYYTHTVSIDDAEGAVVEIPVCIRRFSKEQLQAFSIAAVRAKRRRSQEYIYRKPDCDEQEKETLTVRNVSVPVFKVTDDEVSRRRIAEMSAEQRVEFDRLVEEEERRVAEFYAQTVRDHVWVQAHVRLFFEADGETRQVSTGADLVDAFGGNLAVLEDLTRAVTDHNTLSASEKKRSRLPFGLRLSSPPSMAPVDGARQGGIVGGAVPVASANLEGATEPLGTSQSGSIGMSTSTRARSLRLRRRSKPS